MVRAGMITPELGDKFMLTKRNDSRLTIVFYTEYIIIFFLQTKIRLWHS
jgi:hypothetical protein